MDMNMNDESALLVVGGSRNEEFATIRVASADNDDAVHSDSDESTDPTDNSSDNDENIERSISDRSVQQRPRIKVDLTARDAFVDPFPLLSPMPLKSLRSSCNRLNAQNVARHNMVQDGGTRPSTKSTRPTERAAKSTERSGSDSGADPPRSPCASPTPPRNGAWLTTPTGTARDGVRTTWADPFPTPDVSVRSRRGRRRNAEWDPSAVPKIPPVEEPTGSEEGGRSRRSGAAAASRARLRSAGDAERPVRNVSSANDVPRMRRPSTEDISGALGKIPNLEESTSLEEEGCSRRNGAVAASCARLRSMGLAELPVRKVSSANNMRRMKRPSMEEIWGALKSGPDGNELVAEDDDKNEGSTGEGGTNGEDAMVWEEPSEYQDVQRLDDESFTLVGANKTRQRSSTAPAKTSWTDLRTPFLEYDENCGGDANGIESDDANRRFKNHRATITGASGAGLAKEFEMSFVRHEGGGDAADPTTPNRLRLRAWKKIRSSRAVANAGEIVLSPVRAARRSCRANSRRAAGLVRTARGRLRERGERRRRRRLARPPPRSWWIVVPADHPCKIAWDAVTIVWALLGAYRTHVRIRDRVFDRSPLIVLTEVWFTIDVLLNFVTEHKTRRGEVIRDGKAVWARYLTTWFVIDLLSLVPWERIYVRPIVERIKRRNFFQRSFFRSKAVVRVSRVLRGRHIKLFGRVSKQTGTPLRRMASLAIKYLPKYLMFLRNMKGALVVRALRFVHWLHNMYKKIWVKARNARQGLAARRARRRAGHPIFGRIGPREDDSELDCSDDDGNNDDDDTIDTDDIDTDDDSNDDDDEIDTDGESVVVDEIEDDSVSVDDREYSEPLIASLYRTGSEGSPLVARRHTILSHSKMS